MPDDEMLNDMIARSEEELELFQVLGTPARGLGTIGAVAVTVNLFVYFREWIWSVLLDKLWYDTSC